MRPGPPWLAVALALGGAGAAVPWPAPSVERPPAGFTGGFGEESCVACHIGNDANAYGGSVRIEGLPEAYTPGASYVLTVVLEAEETEAAGFQISARVSEGEARGIAAGLLTPIDERVAITDSAGVSYAHHTPAGSKPPSADGSSWSLTWTAPDRAVPVTLNVAANSGNADNSPLSDLVYTSERRIVPGR